MRRLSDTIAGLSALRGMPGQTPPTGPDRLVDLPDFGSNPGNLRARLYVPASVGPRPALVVVLHGCTQTAAGYDVGSGWSKLADEQGFVLLFPEQQRANNPNMCFNWFASGDIARDEGETLSIRQMVATVMTAHDVDPARVFVTGLSAGGAMAAVLLATCPDLFAGGAVIGGLPYGTAVGVTQALARMRGEDLPDGAALGALARRASPHSGPWPTLSVWHGGADTTVNPANAEAVLAQWRALHGLAAAPATQDIVDGAAHRTWRDAAGRTVIEDHRLPRMGHGTPIATQGPEAGGTAGAFMLDVGLSSTRRIAGFWGIAPAVAHDPRQPRAVPQDPASTPVASPAPASSPASDGVAGVINEALRAAGLMR